MDSVAAFPLPTSATVVPGKEKRERHEGAVTQLLRKKLEMGVEAWVEGGGEEGRRAVVEEGMGGKDGGDGGEGEGWRELWEWVMLRANEEGRGYAWGENEEESEVEEEGGEEEGEKVEKVEEGRGGGMGMGEVLRFMSSGVEGMR